MPKILSSHSSPLFLVMKFQIFSHSDLNLQGLIFNAATSWWTKKSIVISILTTRHIDHPLSISFIIALLIHDGQCTTTIFATTSITSIKSGLGNHSTWKILICYHTSWINKPSVDSWHEKRWAGSCFSDPSYARWRSSTEFIQKSLDYECYCRCRCFGKTFWLRSLLSLPKVTVNNSTWINLILFGTGASRCRWASQRLWRFCFTLELRLVTSRDRNTYTGGDKVSMHCNAIPFISNNGMNSLLDTPWSPLIRYPRMKIALLICATLLIGIN